MLLQPHDNCAVDDFFERQGPDLYLTTDDVLLFPQETDLLPDDVSIESMITRRIGAKTPAIAAAMDTVCETAMAIAMAEAGGAGSIHRNLSPEDQAAAVSTVKHFRNRLIKSPVSFRPQDTLQSILNRCLAKRWEFRTFFITDENGKLVGIVGSNDFDFAPDLSCAVADVMVKYDDVIKGPEHMTHEAAFHLMREQKVKMLPLVRDDRTPCGMYLFSDLKRVRDGGSRHNIDADGHLRVGAAVGVLEGAFARAELLAAKRCDFFHIDTAHGASKNVIDTVRELALRYPHIDSMAGNVSDGDVARKLVDAGAAAVIVGQGGGSSCTTRVVTGVGVPLVSAVFECAKAIRGSGVPIIADGGIRYSGDIAIVIAAGASAVMLGNILAGTDASPGKVIFHKGRMVKVYRGMGSLSAMRVHQGSRDRYLQSDKDATELVPEGVEGYVPYRGTVQETLTQLNGGLKKSMSSQGVSSIEQLWRKARFIRTTQAGLRESHPSIDMSEAPPNYVVGRIS